MWEVCEVCRPVKEILPCTPKKVRAHTMGGGGAGEGGGRCVSSNKQNENESWVK